ncbi:serine/threonine protein kinase [Mycobacterium tuberculosis]|nr:serine/threonine protein kinase [Mycobacterium tuberculosis]
MRPLQPGDPAHLGDHRIIARLGGGGMGEVFLGRSPGGRRVAVKVVHPDLAAQPGFRARFRREVAAARSVGGAFTAPVVDADPDAEVPWLATAYLPGPSLRDAVDAHGPLPPPAVRALGAALTEALVAIHRAGVVHRDLKPGNVMLTADGPRVIDFGIAQAAEATAITASGALLGSPGYLAPEQAAGDRVGPAADVFALGAVLAFAATGSGPFGQGPVHALVHRVLHDPPDLTAVTDPGLRRLIAACLDKDPARRPDPAALVPRLAAPPQGVAWLPAAVSEMVLRPPAAPAPPYAPWGRRVAAALVDGLCIAAAPVAVFLVILLITLVGAALRPEPGDRAGDVLMGWGVPFFTAVAYLGMLVIGLWLCRQEGRTGQTPGKRLLGIRLQHVGDPAPIGFGRAFLRRLAHVLDSLPCYAGYLWPLWDPRRQTFADKIMATAVVTVPAPPGPSPVEAAGRDAAAMLPPATSRNVDGRA